MTAQVTSGSRGVTTDVPARLDRLPWSPFHVRLVIALGACWVLDGFESWVAGSLGDQLADRRLLGMTAELVGPLATVYLFGQVAGALVFGYLADRFGRRRLFFLTLGIYLSGSVLTASVTGSGPDALWILFAVRALSGVGLGGEYAAINSMIDELIPSSHRGRTDILVNGTYWFGATLAGAMQVWLLSGWVDPGIDWRIVVLTGPVIAALVWLLRHRFLVRTTPRRIPESPRWQLLHGEEEKAGRTVDEIEREIRGSGATLLRTGPGDTVRLRPLAPTGYWTLIRVLFRTYPDRATLGVVLMVTQSLLYNALFFSFAGIFGTYFGVPVNEVGLYLIPFAVGNLLGPVLLGPMFDRIGRRRMLARTYGLSGLLLLASVGFFRAGVLTAWTQTLVWCVIFFFVSAGASAAYLTISEVFPLEVRAKAIAAFFGITQSLGAFAPTVFGWLIDRRNPDPDVLALGYVAGAALMLLGALAAQLLAVDAENKALDEVAPPLALGGAAQPLRRPRRLPRRRRG